MVKKSFNHGNNQDQDYFSQDNYNTVINNK